MFKTPGAERCRGHSRLEKAGVSVINDPMRSTVLQESRVLFSAGGLSLESVMFQWSATSAACVFCWSVRGEQLKRNPPSKFRSGPDDWTNKSATLNGVFVRHKRKLSLPLKVKLWSFQHTLSTFYADDPWLLSHVSKTADGRIILYFYCTFNLNLICFWQKNKKKTL